jgi:hypothetical protein
LFEGDEALHGSIDGIRERYGYDMLRVALGASRARR